MSKQAGCNVWLKLENMQPTQSFKIRGIGCLCAKAFAEQGARHFVAVGDTNAALAVAYSGRQLGVPVTVMVPASSGVQTPPIRPKLELEGAVVVECGRTLRDAYAAACAFAEKTEGALVVDSADDPAAVAGNASLASEISIQLQRREPDAIVVAVGSGGLLAGLVAGLRRCRWQRVPVIAVETHNTNSFQRALLRDADDAAAIAAAAATDSSIASTPTAALPSLLPSLERGPEAECGEIRPPSRPVSEGSAHSLPLQRVTAASAAAADHRASEPTVATCLLAGTTCRSALEAAREHPIVPLSITEAMAVEACRRLLDEHQLLVEVGSAAALSVVGKGLVHQIIPGLNHDSHVVVVVTGGANTNFDRLEACRQRFPYPAPIIAKSGHEIFMCMHDAALTPAPGPAVGAVARAAATPSLDSLSINAGSVLEAAPTQHGTINTATSTAPAAAPPRP
ncbi:catabolic L-serine/threonine dehydratase [Coemansia biformis]|uniref:L-serine ammonia-lyase n=1 Tax=Coemansia biformis TaxID=1286918 RepID=A0A9W7YCU9_9FUNG|nr:catabolic L-serine/threonine dehydratase [Coemansia biformis]